MPIRYRSWVFAAFALTVAAVGLVSLPGSVEAQQEEASGILPRVYLDCQTFRCDRQYFRTEITWVNWVRDPQDADVHVIMTSQDASAGGQEFQLDFMGREENSAYQDQVFFRALGTDTEREELDGITHALGLGLARFANFAGFREVVELQGLQTTDTGAGAGVVGPGQVDDPWDLWVFRINANGDYEGETTRTELQYRFGVSASRVTPTWKTNFSADVDREEIEQERTDGSLFTYDQTDWGVNGRVVYSLADHWSVGFSSRVGRNTGRNQELMAQLNPALEYSFFPYPEATRRALTAFYEVGPVYRDYFEETLLGETERVYVEQALSLEFAQRQQWGDARVRVRWSNYMHDFALNNLELDGNLSFRITRGLDLFTGASYSRVQDQIYLSGEGLTDEERFLELAQEQTDYEASVRLGLSYQFGSIFNNVVNNRFPGGGRGGRF